MDAFRALLAGEDKVDLKNGPWSHYDIIEVANNIKPTLHTYLMNSDPKTKTTNTETSQSPEYRTGQHLPICGTDPDSTLQRLRNMLRATDADLLGFVIHTGPSGSTGHFVSLVWETKGASSRLLLVDATRNHE